MAIKVDWDEIKRLWSLGTLSNLALAQHVGIKESTLRYRIKKDNWTRVLANEVRLEREHIVRAKAVHDLDIEQTRKLTDQELVRSEAELQAGVLLLERGEISSLERAAEKLEEVFMAEATRKLDLHKQSNILKSLVETRKTLIDLRRRNFGINDNANGDANKEDDPIKSLFSSLSGGVIEVKAQRIDDDDDD